MVLKFYCNIILSRLYSLYSVIKWINRMRNMILGFGNMILLINACNTILQCKHISAAHLYNFCFGVSHACQNGKLLVTIRFRMLLNKIEARDLILLLLLNQGRGEGSSSWCTKTHCS